MATNNEKIIASTLDSLNLSSATGFRNLGDYLKDVNINLMGKEILSRIGRAYIKSNFYSNGLGDFKKEKTPLGVAVQDIFINTFQPSDWNFTDTEDLKKLLEYLPKMEYSQLVSFVTADEMSKALNEFFSEESKEVDMPAPAPIQDIDPMSGGLNPTVDNSSSTGDSDIDQLLGMI